MRADKDEFQRLRDSDTEWHHFNRRPLQNVLFSHSSIQKGVRFNRCRGGLNAEHLRHIFRVVGLPDTGTVPEMRGRLQENLEKCLMVEIIHIGCACGSGTSAGGEARRVPEQERSSPIVKDELVS
jgi:hypothetical protein